MSVAVAASDHIRSARYDMHHIRRAAQPSGSAAAPAGASGSAAPCTHLTRLAAERPHACTLRRCQRCMPSPHARSYASSGRETALVPPLPSLPALHACSYASSGRATALVLPLPSLTLLHAPHASSGRATARVHPAPLPALHARRCHCCTHAPTRRAAERRHSCRHCHGHCHLLPPRAHGPGPRVEATRWQRQRSLATGVPLSNMRGALVASY
jgi:hypothetical protein